MTERIRPFSNGTQYGDWTSVNCERCAKGANYTVGPDEWPGCEIEAALIEGYIGDGTVSSEIAERMHYQPGKYVWQCGEVEWTQQWIDKVNENRKAAGLEPVEVENA